MEQSQTNRFIEALREGKEYIPISVTSLRIDTVTNFDLYLKARPGEPLVLYAQHDIPFSEEARRRLEETQVEYLYISAGQQGEYTRYLERNLVEIITDDSISTSDKSEVLHTSAQGLVKEIFDDPRLEGGIVRSKEVVQNTVSFLFNDSSALRNLIENAPFEYSTYSHSMNVCVYGIALVQRAGFNDPRILREFGAGALVRDIGVGQIDPSIAENSGQLTVAQFEILKQHTILGEQLLSDIGGVSDTVLDIVRHHHEKLNGTGYPDGLMGEEINLLVRACSIADIFDALSTNRRHQRAMSTFEALRVMGEDMREEIDMDLFKVFIDLMGNPE